jgi:hypothetical protein
MKLCVISCEMGVKAKHDVRGKGVDTIWDLDFFRQDCDGAVVNVVLC